ncbi:unnamed protein product [Rangifer tarandus platyrhynchus]|uniref:Uncharacterized protein n=1 Tax=Rangifer tarandus platyrhynchus TaxID=3082113 RepID=A0AC59YM14_RANTA
MGSARWGSLPQGRPQHPALERADFSRRTLAQSIKGPPRACQARRPGESREVPITQVRPLRDGRRDRAARGHTSHCSAAAGLTASSGPRGPPLLPAGGGPDPALCLCEPPGPLEGSACIT